MEQTNRQTLLSTLARADLSQIRARWQQSVDDYDYEYIRQPEVGMVMAVGRAGGTGEPFNIGEVSVNRCAVRLPSGETGIGYVKGRSSRHALYVALLDALSQKPEHQEQIWRQVINPLLRDRQIEADLKQQKSQASKVEFFTLVRGEAG